MGTTEAELVAFCTREQDAQTLAAIHRMADRIENWGEVAWLAAQQRVAGFVRDGLTAAGVQPPIEVLSYLERQVFEASAVVMLLNVQLRKVVDRFDTAGVLVIVLKGPALVATIYPRADFRIYGDLDLTIRESDEDRAIEILRCCGFEEVEYAAEAARAHASHGNGEGAFHRRFASPEGHATIELHLDPLQLGLKPTCEAERWNRSLPLPGVAGASMLSWEDQVIQLAVHAHKHGFSHLIWLKDLDLLYRKFGQDLDWSLVGSVANQEGVKGSVWYALYLARLILGTPVPDSLLKQFAPSALVRLLYYWVWPPGRISSLGGYLRRRSVQFHAAESLRGMIPSLLLMERRGYRLRAMVRQLLHR
jgi:hypothetical protein